MPSFIDPSALRDYLATDKTTAQFSAANLGSNIRAASENLQRWCHRQFEAVTVTRKLTTHGRAQLAIPDLRTATTVTLNSSALVADASYFLVPDRMDPTMFSSIQLRAFRAHEGGPVCLHGSDWWDRGLDMGWQSRIGRYASLPNDLSIAGSWGWAPLPEPLLHATKVLAAWYTRRPDSLLANVAITPEGNVMSYGELPPEVSGFIADWRRGEQAVAI